MSKKKRRPQAIVWPCLCTAQNLVITPDRHPVLSSCDRCHLIVMLDVKAGAIHDVSHCPRCSLRPEVLAIVAQVGETKTPPLGEGAPAERWLH